MTFAGVSGPGGRTIDLFSIGIVKGDLFFVIVQFPLCKDSCECFLLWSQESLPVVLGEWL